MFFIIAKGTFKMICEKKKKKTELKKMIDIRKLSSSL